MWSLFQGRLPLARVAKRLWRGMRSYFRSGCDARSGTPRNQETRRGIYVIVEESIASTSTSTRRKNAEAVGLKPKTASTRNSERTPGALGGLGFWAEAVGLKPKTASTRNSERTPGALGGLGFWAGGVGLDPRPRKRGTPNEYERTPSVLGGLGVRWELLDWTQDRVNAELQTNTNEHTACRAGIVAKGLARTLLYLTDSDWVTHAVEQHFSAGNGTASFAEVWRNYRRGTDFRNAALN